MEMDTTPAARANLTVIQISPGNIAAGHLGIVLKSTDKMAKVILLGVSNPLDAVWQALSNDISNFVYYPYEVENNECAIVGKLPYKFPILLESPN